MRLFDRKTWQQAIGVLEERPNAMNIPRRKVDTSEIDSFSDVLEEARKLLGYTAGVEDKELLHVLADLEIEYLDEAAVEDYMKSIEKGDFRFVPYRLENYRYEIPIHVLNKALQIKKRLPQAQFLVHHYEEVRQAQVFRGDDPFLSVSLTPGRLCYIEVWEEPKFEGRATPTRQQSTEERG